LHLNKIWIDKYDREHYWNIQIEGRLAAQHIIT